MTSETAEPQLNSVQKTKTCGCSGAGGHSGDCESCRGKAKGGWVYALGTIAPRFPSVSVEKELIQAIGRGDAKGLTDHQAFHAALSKRENGYLVRQLCWVFSVQHVDTYILVPRDPGDYALLAESLRPNPSPSDLDVVIGLRGPVAPPEACNGLRAPIVVFDQLYSFGRESLIHSIPRPEKISAEEFGPMAEELLDRILQVTDNAGSSDEHRALDYAAVRYPAIYARAAEQFAKGSSLTCLEVRPSALSGARKLVDLIFGYTNRSTDLVEKFSLRVDVTEEFPFIVSKLSPYLDH